MTTFPMITRRLVLQALGATTATAALAGCAGAPTAGSPDDRNTPQPPSMNPTTTSDIERIAANPTAIPPPITRTTPATVAVELTTRELVAEVEPGVTYTYMTFDGRVPAR